MSYPEIKPIPPVRILALDPEGVVHVRTNTCGPISTTVCGRNLLKARVWVAGSWRWAETQPVCVACNGFGSGR
jgi:hypothetical protein